MPLDNERLSIFRINTHAAQVSLLGGLAGLLAVR